METLRVLVADDESLRVMSLKGQLESIGHKVIAEASNGKEAVNLARELKPDLAILDIKMPEMDGIEALRQIKEKRPDLPVVLSTAYGEYRQDFATWASDEYLVKSSDLEDLKAIVKRYLKE